MKMTAILETAIPDLGRVFVRFPVAVLTAIALWAFMIWLTATAWPQGWEETGLGLIAAFLGAGIGHLAAEGRAWSASRNLLLAAMLMALAFVLYHFANLFQTSELFLFSGLVLSLFVAAYMRRGVQQAAVWLFGQRLGLAACLATIVGVVFGAGLSAIAEGLRFLFDMSLPTDTHRYIWLTATCLVGPIYGLSLLPLDVNEEINIAHHRDTILERGIAVLVSYVIVPLVAVYALIIHAYAAKIIVLGELPKGEIGTIASLFAFAGTAAWLVAWPWQGQGNWLLRTFTRHWYWLIPVPAALLSIAVARRVSDYGMTPERYGLCLIAAWIFIVFGYLLVRRRSADIRAVIGAMAVLLLLASFGPWGANGLTTQSQMARLLPALAEVGLLKDGKIALPPPPVPIGKGQNIYSIILALSDAHGLAPLIALLPESDQPKQSGKRFDRWAVFAELTQKLGVGNAWQPANVVNFSAVRPLDLQVGQGARLLGPFTAVDGAASPALVQARIDKRMLLLSGPLVTASIPVDRIIRTADAAGTSSNQTMIEVEATPNATLYITDFYSDTSAPVPTTTITFWLVIKA